MLPVVPLLLLCPFMRGWAKLNPQPVPPAAVWGPQIQRGGGGSFAADPSCSTAAPRSILGGACRRRVCCAWPHSSAGTRRSLALDLLGLQHHGSGEDVCLAVALPACPAAPPGPYCIPRVASLGCLPAGSVLSNRGRGEGWQGGGGDLGGRPCTPLPWRALWRGIGAGFVSQAGVVLPDKPWGERMWSGVSCVQAAPRACVLSEVG